MMMVGEVLVIMLCYYWPTGVMLSFDQPQYYVDENMTPLSVGLLLNRTTSEDVIVEVSVNDGSAKGSSYNFWCCKVERYSTTAGIHYNRSGDALVFNVTISSGKTLSLFDVNIIDNMIQDGNKMFSITIRLISTCLPITIKSDTTSVTIKDDEGMIMVWFIYKF